MTKRVLVPLAEGFEEIEALTVVDVLRRAGAEVVTAGIGRGPVTGRSAIPVTPDTTFDAIDPGEFDMIVLPGGMPASATLRDDDRVLDALRRVAAAGGHVCAICAAPIALRRAGLLEGAAFTSYPGMRPDLPQEGYREERVVVSGRMITSRGPGTAMEFALALVEALEGARTAREIALEILAP